jgi:hypothetical protein
LSNFVIPSLKNFICAVSKRCSSLFFSTQASLPNPRKELKILFLFQIYFSRATIWVCLMQAKV